MHVQTLTDTVNPVYNEFLPIFLGYYSHPLPLSSLTLFKSPPLLGETYSYCFRCPFVRLFVFIFCHAFLSHKPLALDLDNFFRNDQYETCIIFDRFVWELRLHLTNRLSVFDDTLQEWSV